MSLKEFMRHISAPIDAYHLLRRITCFFVALNPETGTTTQGESIEEALSNLREATALYLAVVLYRCTGN
jgi:predicted RNase H-like HicB family nuclease